VVAEQAAALPEPAARPRLGPVALVVRTLGELLITAGVVVLLFAAYQLVWTTVTAQHAQRQIVAALRHQWAQEPPPGVAGPIPTPAPGQAFALLLIPRLGRGFVVPVVQGVTLPDLHRGVGHYPASALPGGVGNFAVAGHRATNGQPFVDLDAMRPGDAVVVETAVAWFTYRVTQPWILVAPTDVSVVLPVPGRPGVAPTQRLLTLTTCNPRWASYQRLIVYGRLVAAQPRRAGELPAALVGAGYAGAVS